MQNQRRKYVQGKCVSNTQKCQTRQQSYKVLTRMYKVYLRGVLDIRKVREAQICRWKKILPHNRGETVTQISSFTSQRYKVLWGLAKSDNISLPREVSFNSPPDFYTPSEHWSWGRPRGDEIPKQASYNKKNKTTYFLCTQDHPKARGERIRK